jgi:hypothetical protein
MAFKPNLESQVQPVVTKMRSEKYGGRGMVGIWVFTKNVCSVREA